ncbi:18489_t:CDS:1, partial [Gigaspora rosea]
AYADDLTIGIGLYLDWLETQKLLNTYEVATGARINKQKTKLVPLTDLARRANLP